MSYDSAEPFTPEKVFSGGYVDNTPENTLADNFAPFLRNCRLDGTAIIDRPGHSLLTEFTLATYPRGLGSYLRTNSANDRLVVRYNESGTEKLVTVDEDGNQTAITTGANITSDNRMTFQNIGDVIYCMNGSDDFGKLDGTTYSTPVTGITNFAPAFSVVFNGSHWASGWSSNPGIVYKSVGDDGVGNDMEDFNGTGSDQFAFKEQVVGLATNSQAIFYFTQTSIAVTGTGDIQDIGGAINYITRDLTVKEGAVNHSSIITAGNDVFFITPSNKIVQIARGANIDGFEVFELSERPYSGISRLMASLDDDQSDCFGYFLPKQNLIKWFFKSQGSTFLDTCIVYDRTKDAFLVDSNKYFYDGIAFKGKNYTISNIEAKLYQDEFGHDDEDAAISFRYETKYFDLGLPTRKKELWESRTYVAINRLAELNQFIVIDGNTVDQKQIDKDNVPISTGGIGTAPVGTFGIGTGGGFTGEDTLFNVDLIRTKGNLQKKGKRIKFVFTNDSLAGRVRLEDLQMLVEVLPPEASELTV